jgi:hypothetical protein
MPKEPCSLHTATKHPLDLVGRYTFFAGAHQMDDLQPQMQRQMGRLENGPHPHREGLAAGVALVEAGAGRLALQAADALGFPAMVADGTVGPQPRLHIGESGGFVLEMRGRKNIRGH